MNGCFKSNLPLSNNFVPINFVGLDIDPTPSYGITVRCRLSGLKIHFNSNKMICCIRMITTIKFRIRGYDSLAQINSSVI